MAEHSADFGRATRRRRRFSGGSGSRVQSHDEAAAARMTEAKEADRG